MSYIQNGPTYLQDIFNSVLDRAQKNVHSAMLNGQSKMEQMLRLLPYDPFMMQLNDKYNAALGQMANDPHYFARKAEPVTSSLANIVQNSSAYNNLQPALAYYASKGKR